MTCSECRHWRETGRVRVCPWDAQSYYRTMGECEAPRAEVPATAPACERYEPLWGQKDEVR